MRTDDRAQFLRRVFSVVAVSFVIYLLFPANVRALSCAPRSFTLSEAYEAADSIIVGVVTECKEEVSSDAWANGGSDCSFVSVEVLKESKAVRDYRGVASSGGCGLSLFVGKQYLLFLNSDNRPMHFSAGLDGDRHSTGVPLNHKRILREFRDGVVHDLSDPWIFREDANACTISHSVGGHRISFSSGKADTSESSNEDWTRETLDGKTIIKGNVRPGGENSMAPRQDVEVVIVGELPNYPVGAPMLSISFLENPPAPIRQAAITVGSRSWSLYRTEQSLSFGGLAVNTQVNYQVGGDVAEQILSTMSKPSDVSVTATLVGSADIDSESMFQAGPNTGLAKESISPDAAGSKAYQGRRDRPEPILRLETRSTQLTAAAESFQACYEGSER